MAVDVRDADDDRTEDGARHAARAADDDHQQQIDREIHADRPRIDQAEECCVERAREPREGAGVRERGDLDAARRDADRLGGELVVTHRFERATRTAAQEVERQQSDERDHGPGVPERGEAADGERAELWERDVRDAAGSAEGRRDLDDADDDESERERRHREIVTAEAQRDEAEHDTEDRREQRAGDGREHELRPEREECGPRDRGFEIAERIRADAEEAGLTDGDRGDVAEEHREADRGDRVDRGERRRLHEIGVAVRDETEDDDDREEDGEEP